MQAVHEGVACDECSQFPLTGARYKCGNCTDYDLCENCEKTTSHDPSLVFIQIRTPLPDVYADLHTPLLSTNVYTQTPPSPPSPVDSPPQPRRGPRKLACKRAAVRKSCEKAAPEDINRTKKVTIISPSGSHHNLTVNDRDTVEYFLILISRRAIDTDVAKLASSVSSGRFTPSYSNPKQYLKDAGLADGTVFDLRNRVSVRDD